MTQWISIGLIAAGLAVFAIALARRGRRPGRPTAMHAGERTRELESVAADARELGAHLAAMLDEKAARIERLIAEADERIRHLERAPAEPPRPAAFVETRPAPGVDPVSRQVYELADKGLPSVEIARRLGQLTGKVELILALRQR
jgi:hypothetical protein